MRSLFQSSFSFAALTGRLNHSGCPQIQNALLFISHPDMLVAKVVIDRIIVCRAQAARVATRHRMSAAMRLVLGVKLNFTAFTDHHAFNNLVMFSSNRSTLQSTDLPPDALASLSMNSRPSSSEPI